MKLVIAEKPSVGAAIAAVIGANEKRSGYFEGSGYLVSWCIGHLISLADAATYNEQYRKWKLEHYLETRNAEKETEPDEKAKEPIDRKAK